MASADLDASSKVILSFQCSKLRNLDTLSKSDPCLVLYAVGSGSKTEAGRTEIVKDNLNPKFSTNIPVRYFFEKRQMYRVEVYDIDGATGSSSSGLNVAAHQLIGFAEFALGDIIGSRTNSITRELTNSSGRTKEGSVTVYSECVKERVTGREEPGTKVTEHVRMTIRGQKLAKKDFFGKSDPYVIIYRKRSDGSLNEVKRTEIIKCTLDPVFAQFEMPLEELCLNDPTAQLTFECWDWDKNSDDDLIGRFDASLEDVLAKGATTGFVLLSKSGKSAGTLFFDAHMFTKTTIIPPHFDMGRFSFLDYLSNGWEISLVVAIDFTGSNGNPRSRSSLHYIDDHSDNEYESAIKSVGAILEPYDYDKSFPVFGFGGERGGRTSHCFALNMTESNPECHGVQGIMDAYHSAIEKYELSGPTNFENVIAKTRGMAEAAKRDQQKKFYILLILTDGEISDMPDTKDEIVKCSHLPMSMVIVGVGSANFENMDALDADDGPLRGRYGKVAVRDIVQFVPRLQEATN